MNLDGLTLGQIKELNHLLNGKTEASKPNPFEIGKKYLIRTVTMIQTGELKEKCGDFLVLKDASWIADTGRFSESLENQENFKEVEPFKNDVIVNLGSIVDATEIQTLMRKLK